MKATLNFNLDDPQDQLAHKRAVSAVDAYLVLWDVANDVFRPARKHGYQDRKIQDLLESLGSPGEELIGLLEEKFFAIMSERSVSLSDLE